MYMTQHQKCILGMQIETMLNQFNKQMTDCLLQCTDVHMVSDSEGDDFEDAPEFGVDESEIFGMGSSSCRKSPMSNI